MQPLGELRITTGHIDAPDGEAHAFADALVDRGSHDGAWQVYVCANDACDCACRRYIPVP